MADDLITTIAALIILICIVLIIVGFVWTIWTLAVLLVLIFALGWTFSLNTMFAALGIGILGCAVTGALGGKRYVTKE